MDDQVVLLLELQDLQAKIQELEAGDGLSDLERSHFGMDTEAAVAALRGRAGELEARLSEPTRRRYRMIAERLDRPMVPVIGGTCYGCFMAVPTAAAAEADPNAHMQVCEYCGRFLYFPR